MNFGECFKFGQIATFPTVCLHFSLQFWHVGYIKQRSSDMQIQFNEQWMAHSYSVIMCTNKILKIKSFDTFENFMLLNISRAFSAIKFSIRGNRFASFCHYIKIWKTYLMKNCNLWCWKIIRRNNNNGFSMMRKISAYFLTISGFARSCWASRQHWMLIIFVLTLIKFNLNDKIMIEFCISFCSKYCCVWQK